MRSCRIGTRSRLAAPLAAIVLLLSAMSPACAQRLDSPLEFMYGPDTEIVAGKLIEINPAGRIVIERKDVLWGRAKPPLRIDARVAPGVMPGLKTGDRYVMAYTMYRHDPSKAVGMAANPQGAVVLENVGIEPALFRDTPEIRAILSTGRSEHGRESRRLLDLLLTALKGDDAQLQNLAAGELAFEPELTEHLKDADRAVIEKVVRDAHAAPRVRSTLLEGAARQPKTLGGWWQAAAMEIVATTPVDGYSDKATDPVTLILTALEVLDRYAVKVPPDALKRWVWNPNPPLVERVCVMLRRDAPEQERPTIQLALADPKLPETTRKFLNDHLRRLDKINARRAQKEGSG